jgi:hypothetical protein
MSLLADRNLPASDFSASGPIERWEACSPRSQAANGDVDTILTLTAGDSIQLVFPVDQAGTFSAAADNTDISVSITQLGCPLGSGTVDVEPGEVTVTMTAERSSRIRVSIETGDIGSWRTTAMRGAGGALATSGNIHQVVAGSCVSHFPQSRHHAQAGSSTTGRVACRSFGTGPFWPSRTRCLGVCRGSAPPPLWA